MAGTPLFLITDLGLAVASVAKPQGPYIHITSFKIGSGFGYTPQETDPGLNGNLLFTGQPTTYSNIGNNTIDIVLQIPPEAGPFDFGEVGVFLEDGTMFAKAVFDTPQTKFSSLGTNVVNSYTFHCLLKLQQSVSVFQIDTNNGPPAVWEVFNWSDVFPPGISANPDIPLTMVRELNEYGDSSLLTNTSDAYWTLDSTSYKRYMANGGGSTFPVANSTTGSIQIARGHFREEDVTLVNRRFLIQTADGFFRSVSQVADGGANFLLTLNGVPLLNAPPVGSNITIYRDDQDSGSIYYSQIIDPPPPYVLPVATTTTLGGVKQGANVTIAGDGTLSVAPPYVLPIANGGQLGGVKVGSGLNELPDGTISAQQYVLPIANGGQLGGVKIGSGIAEAGDGTISVTPYTLPIASSGQLGGVKIGSGIVEAGDGTISVPYTPPIGAGWTARASVIGNFTEVNNTAHIVAYVFSGGNWLNGGNNGDLRQNPTNLTLSVNGVSLGQSTDNLNGAAHSAWLMALVPPGGTVQCTSNPFSAAGQGTIQISTFTGLMV